MNGQNWNAQLDRLRQGKLILLPPGENGLSVYANTNLYELRTYLAALEAGYRAQSEMLAAYRGHARGKTLGQMVKNQWSDGAALGYAAMALIQVGNTPDQVVGYLELMEEFMDRYGLQAAAEYHNSLKDGGTPPLPEEWHDDD